MGGFNIVMPKFTTPLNPATQVASGVSGQFQLGLCSSATFILDITSTSAPTTLDVGIQFQNATSSVWYTFAKFAQVTTGAGPFVRFLSMNFKRAISEAGVEFIEPIIARATTSPSISVVTTTAVANNMIIASPQPAGVAPVLPCRIVWVLAGTSYTFSVSVIEAPANNLVA